MNLFQKYKSNKKADTNNINKKSSFENKWGNLTAEFGHTEIPNLLLIGVKKLNITPTEFLTLTAILSFKFAEDMPWPSVSNIAKRTNTDQRNVRKHLVSLDRKGLVTRVSGQHVSNDYDFSPLYTKLVKLAKSDLALGQKRPQPTVNNDLPLMSESPSKEYLVEEEKIKKHETPGDIAESNEKIQQIYDYFNKKINYNSGNSKLTSKRKNIIRARLKDCGEDMIIKAIDNISSVDFYLGNNKSQWKATLDYTLRSYEKVEELSNLKPYKSLKEEEEARKLREAYEALTSPSAELN
jgi:hypothetical protein